MAGTAFRKRPLAQWCFLTFGSPVLEVSWSVLLGVPFLQGVLCPCWQRPASPSFRAQMEAWAQGGQGWAGQTTQLEHFSPVLPVYILDRRVGPGGGPEGTPRAPGEGCCGELLLGPSGGQRAWEQSHSSGTSCAHA